LINQSIETKENSINQGFKPAYFIGDHIAQLIQNGGNCIVRELLEEVLNIDFIKIIYKVNS